MKLTIGLVAAMACLAGLSGAVWAEAPDSSLRPAQRPNVTEAAPVVAQSAGAIGTAPKPRPMATASAVTSADPAVANPSPGAILPRFDNQLAAASAIKPKARPSSFAKPIEQKPKGALLGVDAPETIQPAALTRNTKPGKELVTPSVKGSVCGDPSIKGEVLAPIGARVNGCGIANPVRVTSIAGIRLSQAATIDCATAKAMKRWIDKGLKPAYGKQEVVQLQIAGSYMCRTRNHKKGAKISEHGRGRAIDISGITFTSGKTVTVKGNYDATMRKAHRAACGIFGTTLGPGSDGMHEDHLHFDVANHRNGSYCR